MMRPLNAARILAGASVALSVLMGGCSDPATARKIARRQEKAHRPIELYVAREARSPRRLADTFDLARRSEQRHAEKDAANRAFLGGWLERESREWEEKEPALRERIAAHLNGHPEKIPWTIRAMFF